MSIADRTSPHADRLEPDAVIGRNGRLLRRCPRFSFVRWWRTAGTSETRCAEAHDNGPNTRQHRMRLPAGRR
jgi:hypothetical protein